MTADQFVAALRRAAKLDRLDRESVRPWATAQPTTRQTR
jgi:hypothetical protein